MNLNNKAKEIAELIKSTREFAELKQAKMSLDSNKGLAARIESFKKKESKLMSSGVEISESSIRQLQKEFNELSGYQEVARFLKAERAVSDMLFNVQKVISDLIEAALRN